MDISGKAPLQEFFLCVNERSHGCRGFTFAESNIVCGEYATKVSQESEPGKWAKKHRFAA